jgi:hypothetical protein
MYAQVLFTVQGAVLCMHQCYSWGEELCRLQHSFIDHAVRWLTGLLHWQVVPMPACRGLCQAPCNGLDQHYHCQSTSSCRGQPLQCTVQCEPAPCFESI